MATKSTLYDGVDVLLLQTSFISYLLALRGRLKLSPFSHTYTKRIEYLYHPLSHLRIQNGDSFQSIVLASEEIISSGLLKA
jgi:hypothetical protein